MDSLTHLVAGALTPIAFAHAPKRTALIVFGIVAGQFPDIDVFFGSSPEYLLTQHRGITHALILQPLMALCLALPFALILANSHRTACSTTNNATFRKLLVAPNLYAPDEHQDKKFGLGTLFLIALFALLVHIFLDTVTGFGTQILLPFSPERIGLNSIFIIDLLLTIPALILLCIALLLPSSAKPEKLQGSWLAALRKTNPKPAPKNAPKFFSKRSQAVARIALCWIILYPLVATGIKAGLEQFYSKAWNVAPNQTLTLMAEPFSPFVWKAVIADEQEYKMGTLFALKAESLEMEKDATAWRTLTKVDPNLYSRLEEQAQFFTYFKNFSPDMRQRTKPTSESDLANADEQKVTTYVFGDLRYIISPKSLAHFFKHGDPNFQLEAKVQDDGTLLAYRFLNRGRDEHTPWEKP